MNAYFTSEEANYDSVYITYYISSGKKNGEPLKSKSVNNFFAKPKDRTVPIRNFFVAQ